jgi:hypothetical protein
MMPAYDPADDEPAEMDHVAHWRIELRRLAVADARIMAALWRLQESNPPPAIRTFAEWDTAFDHARAVRLPVLVAVEGRDWRVYPAGLAVPAVAEPIPQLSAAS